MAVSPGIYNISLQATDELPTGYSLVTITDATSTHECRAARILRGARGQAGSSPGCLAHDQSNPYLVASANMSETAGVP